MVNWTHLKTIFEGESLRINGLDLWKTEWRGCGEKVDIRDPFYGQHFTFDIYEMTDGQTTAKFAAGEFSNCVWGIYVER